MHFVNLHSWFTDQNFLCLHPHALRKIYRYGMKLRPHQTVKKSIWFEELGKPHGPAWAEAWRRMQIQMSIWKSFFSWVSGPSWHWAFPVPILTVLGLLRGERRPILLPGSCPSTAHTKTEKEASTPAGQEGLGSWTWRHSQLLGWAVLLVLWSRKTLKLLPGRGFCSPFLALISSLAFITQENVGAVPSSWYTGLGPRTGPSWAMGRAQDRYPLTLDAQRAQVLLLWQAPSIPWGPHSSSLVSKGSLHIEIHIQLYTSSNVQYRKIETVKISLNSHILLL